MSKKSKIQQIQVFLAMFTAFIGVAIAITVSLVQHLDACQQVVDMAGYVHMAGMSVFSTLSIGALIKASQLALNV